MLSATPAAPAAAAEEGAEAETVSMVGATCSYVLSDTKVCPQVDVGNSRYKKAAAETLHVDECIL